MTLSEVKIDSSAKTIRDPRFWIIFAVSLISAICNAQSTEDTYVWPTNQAVLTNLKRWQGWKFGILIHQGLYSQLGIVESWALCPEDWVTRPGYDDYYAFARDYRGAKSKFNPVDFDPAKWARAFKAAGAKYVIYTTKHHDGFCLFDTRYTDFKVTDPGCPFASDTRSNMAREVFTACRNEGLGVGAYFSKPDWTSPYFWWPYFPPKDRNPNYDITKYPDRWKKFIAYTHNQLSELVSDYGPLDILWLDGCWVRPLSTINPQVAEFCKYPHDLDIDIPTIAAEARGKQPGILIVDRWVPGEFENYLTPEQKTPDRPCLVPWESCISLGNSWGWTPRDRLKSSREVIQLLVKVAAKGGNLLLGVGPNGKGEFEPGVYDRLAQIGAWLQTNGDAIYETSPVKPYQDGQISYTRKGESIFAIYLPRRDEKELPNELNLKIAPQENAKISLPSRHMELTATSTAEGLKITIPPSLRGSLAEEPAVVFEIAR